jgi:integration host factor subunit beta
LNTHLIPHPQEGRGRLRREGGVMNKAELITKVSEKANVTQKVAKVIVDTLFDGMKESLEKGERIEIRGFGSFVVRNYGGYKGRNPKTGKIVDVLPKKLPFFKVGKELKEMVNTGGT